MPRLLAKTFVDDDTGVTVELLNGPTKIGMCKVAFGNRLLMRHVDRLEPLSQEAKDFLGK